MKIVLVVANNGFRDPEAEIPEQIIEEKGGEIVVSALETGQAIGDEGTIYNVDQVVAEIKPDNFEAVVFVGGPGMVGLVEDPEMIELAKNFYSKGKLTTAICVAPAILAYAHLISGKKVTAWDGVEEKMIAVGANFTGDKVSQDGLLITGSGPDAAKEFGETIVRALLSGKY